jgi:hypothetical protein
MTIENVEKVLKDLVSYRVQRKVPIKTSKAKIIESGKGKNYPGTRPLITYRAIAWSSPTVFSILVFRKNQVAKKDITIVPASKEEPPFRFDLLEYDLEVYPNIPSLDISEARALTKIALKLKKNNLSVLNRKKIREILTPGEIALLDHLNDKHVDFYFERTDDSKRILNFLRKPDPYFMEENSWFSLVHNILDDLLTIDRGVLYKIRNEKGELVALTPLDGTTIKPIVNEETGAIEYYVQEVDGEVVHDCMDKKDIVIFKQNYSPDVYLYGYGIPPLEVLYTVVLTDIFIDKGNLDYYKKGGSVPEGIIAIEPPGEAEGDPYPQLSREQLEGIQRQLQALLIGDHTQIPIVSGGKFTWIDFKGKRRDMQYKELADYVARKICAVYQVSPQDVGILEGANKAVAEVMASLTKAKGLEPLLSTISRGFDSVIKEFRKEGDLKLWFDDEDLEKERERWTITQGQLSAGVKTINEVRMERGLPPVPWGDTPFMGLRNWTPPQEEEQPGQPGQPGGSQQGAQALLQALAQNKSFVEIVNPLVNDPNYLSDEEEKKEVFKALGINIPDKNDNNGGKEIKLEDFTKEVLLKDILDYSLYCDEEELSLILLVPEAVNRNKMIAFLSSLGIFESTPSIYLDTGIVKISLKTFRKTKVPEEVKTEIDTLLERNKFDYVIFCTNPNIFDEITNNLDGLDACNDKFTYLTNKVAHKLLERPMEYLLDVDFESKEDVLKDIVKGFNIKSKFIFEKSLKPEQIVRIAKTLIKDRELDRALLVNKIYADFFLLFILGNDDFEGGPEENSRYGKKIAEYLNDTSIDTLLSFIRRHYSGDLLDVYRNFLVTFTPKDHVDVNRFIRYSNYHLKGDAELYVFYNISPIKIVKSILENRDLPIETKNVVSRYISGEHLDDIDLYNINSLIKDFSEDEQ